jgi:hypothetical protein
MYGTNQIGVFLETAIPGNLSTRWPGIANHPRARRELFKRDLARSFLPGASLVPDADLDISLLLKSSTSRSV